MINFEKDSTRNFIINLLSSGSTKATKVLANVKSIKPGITKQAFYFALRKLIKEEIVVKYGKKVMLNQIWIDRLNEFVKKVEKNYLENYKKSKVKNDVSEISEGDRIIYLFKDLNLFDAFWNHVFSIIVKKTNVFAPLYLYNPHDWFLFSREKSEKYMYSWIKRRKPKTYFAIGGNTDLDKTVRKSYSSNSIEIATGERMVFEENYYLAIIGNYLVETFLDKKLADRINVIYNKEEDEKEAS